MKVSTKVRKVARDITIAYAQHIKEKIASGDDDYTSLGIDDDFLLYESLFKSVFSKALGVPVHEARIFTHSVVIESLDTVEKLIVARGYEMFLGNKSVCESVFGVCMFILKKVKEDEFEDYELEVN
jgi:hypothetical protein